MPFMDRMERQWTERQLGLEEVSVIASVRIADDAERVWEFVFAPESAYLADPAVVEAFRVSGTPTDEVGEQHCFIRDEGEGRRSVVPTEFVELQRPVRMVTTCPTYPTTCTTTYELRPAGTDVILACEMAIWVEKGLCRRVRPALQAEVLSQLLGRIAAGIRSGLALPGMEGP